jgi:hypothetical protein
MNREAIGGYFQLELPYGRKEYHSDALRFQSSRAAFLSLLRSQPPTAVWMPWYICDSMIEPLRMSGTTIRRYEIDESLRVKSVDLADGEWLLYVNYFGVCDRNVDDALSRFPRERVVIDNAQAFFARPSDCLATLYSPRKFFGVPDGGYLVTRTPIGLPETVDQSSIHRFSHLLKRLGADAELGYADFVAAEESLNLQEPKRMSALTQRMLTSIDYADARARRADNFAHLCSTLGRHNRFAFDLNGGEAPLCYPFLGAPAELRGELQRRRIYAPSYWPGMAETESMPEFERNLPASLLFLPCDQRLSREQLDYVAQLLLDRLR